MNIFGLIRKIGTLWVRSAESDSEEVGHSTHLERHKGEDSPLRSEIYTRDELSTHARKLAAEQRIKITKGGRGGLYRRFWSNARYIRQAYFTFSDAAKDQEDLTPGAEWLLDNYHVIREQVRELEKQLPSSYYKTLPKLSSGEYAGFPRVYQIALEFILHTDAVVDGDILKHFCQAFQEHALLTIGEIWAIPIMLRLALIENLRRLAGANLEAREKRESAEELVRIIAEDDALSGTDLLLFLADRLKERPQLLIPGAVYLGRELRGKGPRAALALQWLEERVREKGHDPDEMALVERRAHVANQISTGNTITSFRTMQTLNWKDWFEGLSIVDAILRKDPGEVYRVCDFQTRDRCRNRIEYYARKLKWSEAAVAEETVRLASEAKAAAGDTERLDGLALQRSFVGYYLLDLGELELEKHLKFKAPIITRIKRRLKKATFPLYALGVSLITLLIVGLAANYLHNSEGSWFQILVLVLLFLIPASDLGIHSVQWIVTHLTYPFVLPKLNFDDGVPESCRTIVTVHALFRSKAYIKRAVDYLEVRYLGNDDSNIYFALLADLQDAEKEVLPGDEDLISYAEGLFDELNAKYFPENEQRFFLLFRSRVWNETDQMFLGWERKRGKIMEFNRLVMGDDETTFKLNVGNLEQLRSVRYVITLDFDSQLPRGVARKMIGTIAHPLNYPIFDVEKNVVTRGYGVIQPRVGVSLESAHVSRFSKIFSGHAGLDPYTSAVSEVYQDIFHEGSYVGKGIYDLHAFEQALEKRVPENSLLSHDLFEGLFARVALATDIELFDETPSRFNVHSMRQHRWVRGDWQLFPWIFPKIPGGDGEFYDNPISALGKWKIVDNLRRSLVPPSIFLFLCAAWFWFAGSVLIWSLIVILVLAFPVYANLATALMIPPLRSSMEGYAWGIVRDLMLNLKRTLLTISFLPHQAYLMCHAAAISLYRVYVSKKNLLEWVTADHAERRTGNDLGAYLSQMAPALLTTALITILLSLVQTTPVIYAAPFLLLWLLSPVTAAEVSRSSDDRFLRLKEKDEDYLQKIARETWKHFDDLLSERDNYLVPDNIQVAPNRVVARRTSPTNVGLSILSVMSAFDFGFITLPSLVARISKVFETLGKLERFQGHFLNWYATESLAPLLPRYVSFVDSGNLAGHLIAAKAAFNEYQHAPIMSPRHWEHVRRRLNYFAALSRDLDPNLSTKMDHLIEVIRKRERGFKGLVELLDQVSAFVEGVLSGQELSLVLSGQYGFELNKFLEELNSFITIRDYIKWYALLPALRESVESCQGKVDPEVFTALRRRFGTLEKVLPKRTPTFSLLAKLNNRAAEILDKYQKLLEDQPEELSFIREVSTDFRSVLDEGVERLNELRDEIDRVVVQSEEIVSAMDFRFLYSKEKKLFSIGYDVDEAKMDTGFYDHLASEARLGSFVAIAKGDVSEKHWFSLRRLLTASSAGKALASWSGTMFEYMMPVLVTKNYPNTILSRTYKRIVKAQRKYARKRSVPWGVSESGYSGVDFEKTYQYRAFGVPGLGLKRGLSEDLVISPYSTFLAISIAPREALKNLRYLEREGARGEYGFYESLDYTVERLSEDERCHVVQSFLSHHQGMILVSLNNFLNQGIFQKRFHFDPRVRATELLLHEKFPEHVPAIVPHHAELSFLEREEVEERVPKSEKLLTPHTRVPRTRLLSNGRYSVMVDNAGSGWSFYGDDLSLTRWREDSIINDSGYYIFIRDLDSGKIWSVAYQPTRIEPETYEVIFNPGKVEFKRRDFGIGLHTEISVSPEDDVEVRRITVTNSSSRKRHLEITSFAEVVLGDTAADAAHMAFAKMFVESEFAEDFKALIFSRRPRSASEEHHYLLHLMSPAEEEDKIEYETSRMAFIGRGNTIHSPAALQQEKLSGGIGLVLDPVFSLRTSLEITPGTSKSLCFVTAFAKSREQIMHLAQLYNDQHAVSRAFEMAWSQSNVELRYEQFSVAQAHAFQKLANALFFNIEELRASKDVISSNRLVQSDFWRFSISGDLPIVLLKVSDSDEIRNVEEILLAHEYLRTRGLSFDLVILNEFPGGYFQELQELLQALVNSGPSAKMVEKKGGIYIRSRTQLSEDELLLLQARARVVLDSAKGSLPLQLKRVDNIKQPVIIRKGLFSPAIGAEEDGQPYYPGELDYEFANGIGGFIDGGKTYCMHIHNGNLPPLPWSNVIANDKFGFVVTERGGGYTWSDNSRENRLTPWGNDSVTDRSGEAVYIRDRESGSYWCPTPAPVRSERVFKVRHGYGYSEFDSKKDDIFSSLSLSNSLDKKVKWWQLRLINDRDVPAKLEVYLYLEWTLGVLRRESYPQIVTGYDQKNDFLYALNRYNNEFADQVVYTGANYKLHTYTTSRREFVGRNRDVSVPYVLERGAASGLANLIGSDRGFVKLSKKTGVGFDSCAVLKVLIDMVPHEDLTVQFYLGAADSIEEARESSESFKSIQVCSDERGKSKQFWDSITSTVEVNSPDRSLDLMLNGWLLYQNLACRLYGRSAFYQSGGAYGFRDQLQDVMALLYSKPELAREQILLHASRQFVEGDVQHWWHPPTGRGVRTRISDDYLWLPYVVHRYLEVTGDTSILDQEVSFLESSALERFEKEAYIMPRVSTHKGTIYEHCIIALDRSLKFGKNGLPLIGAGDWNDGMNEVGGENGGESVWLAWFLADILKKFIEIVKTRKDRYRQKMYKDNSQSLAKAVEKLAWDGEWYLRAFFEDGTKLGSSENEECQIDSLAQSWSVISGAGDSDRASQAMESAFNRLVDYEERIIRLLTPPFDKSALEPGYIKGYLPGVRENGGQYTHAAAWVVIAASLLEQGSNAVELFSILNPVNHTFDQEEVARYQGEPYVTCGDVYSVDPHVGRAGWSWYTGSGAWLYRAGIENILGLRVYSEHFEIHPCIHENWPGYKIKYRHEGVLYEIEVVSPLGTETGVERVEVDGKEVPDQKVRFIKDSQPEQIVQVKVEMGEVNV